MADDDEREAVAAAAAAGAAAGGKTVTGMESDSDDENIRQHKLRRRAETLRATSAHARRGATTAVRSRKRPPPSDDIEDDSESGEAPPSRKAPTMRQEHGPQLETFLKTLKFYTVTCDIITSCFIFDSPVFLDAAQGERLFIQYKKRYSVSALHETFIRSTLNKVRGGAEQVSISNTDFAARRTAARRQYVFEGGGRLSFADDGTASFLKQTKPTDAFFLRVEMVKMRDPDVVRIRRFVRALTTHGGAAAAHDVIDTRGLVRAIANVVGNADDAEALITLQARAFAGCEDAEEWLIVAFSLIRDIGKTFLMKLPKLALGMANALAKVAENGDRDAIAYGAGGQQARKEVTKQYSPCRFVVVDELEAGRPVKPAAMIKPLQNAYRSTCLPNAKAVAHEARMATLVACTVNSANPRSEFAEWTDRDAERMLAIGVGAGSDAPKALANMRALKQLLTAPDGQLLTLALLVEYATKKVPTPGTAHSWPTLNKLPRVDAAPGCAPEDMLRAWLDENGDARIVEDTSPSAPLLRTPVFEAAGIDNVVPARGRGRSGVNAVLDAYMLGRFKIQPCEEPGGSRSMCYAGVRLLPVTQGAPLSGGAAPATAL